MKVELVEHSPENQCHCESILCHHGDCGCRNFATSYYRVDDFVVLGLCQTCSEAYAKHVTCLKFWRFNLSGRGKMRSEIAAMSQSDRFTMIVAIGCFISFAVAITAISFGYVLMAMISAGSFAGFVIAPLLRVPILEMYYPPPLHLFYCKTCKKSFRAKKGICPCCASQHPIVIFFASWEDIQSRSEIFPVGNRIRQSTEAFSKNLEREEK
jgi:hypothetical protein